MVITARHNNYYGSFVQGPMKAPRTDSIFQRVFGMSHTQNVKHRAVIAVLLQADSSGVSPSSTCSRQTSHTKRTLMLPLSQVLIPATIIEPLARKGSGEKFRLFLSKVTLSTYLGRK